MALSEANRRFVIIQVQRILQQLSAEVPEIPRVNPDGLWSDALERALRAYQKWRDIPENGRIDEQTFVDLQAVLRARGGGNRSRPIWPFERNLAGGKLTEGDQTDLVLIVQLMLRTLRTVYGNIDEVPLSGYYDQRTGQAVREIQKIHGLSENGEVNLLTWNALADAYTRHHDSEGD